MMTAPELKPCPFCGSGYVELSQDGCYVLCRLCDAEGPFIVPTGEDKAIAAWNRRADLPAVEAGVVERTEVAISGEWFGRCNISAADLRQLIAAVKGETL
jgi:Lar family restriction alleviation protein